LLAIPNKTKTEIGVTLVATPSPDGGYSGGAYSPTEERVYLVPYDDIAETDTWYFLKNKYAQTGPTALATVTGGGIFNYSL
jgi:hypothetical protein